MNRQIILEKFFGDIGLGETSPEEKEQLFEKIFTNLENRILLRLRSILNTEDLLEWEKLDTDEALDNFYKEKDIDMDKIAEEEARLSREQLIQTIAHIQGKME